jgi:hypothetical protein
VRVNFLHQLGIFPSCTSLMLSRHLGGMLGLAYPKEQAENFLNRRRGLVSLLYTPPSSPRRWIRCPSRLYGCLQIIHYPQWMVLLVTSQGASRDFLNHVHDVGCIATALKRALRYCLYFLPNKVKHIEVKSMGVRSHSHKKILVVGWNVRAISFSRSHGLPKKTVQVSIERKKI